MEEPTESTPVQLRAEWMRAISFIVLAVGMTTMAFVHPSRNTTWWMTGLAIAGIGCIGLLRSAFLIEPTREIFRSLLRLRPVQALESLIELNRIPPMDAPHRTPRILAAMFGALAGATGVLVIARLLTT